MGATGSSPTVADWLLKPLLVLTIIARLSFSNTVPDRFMDDNAWWRRVPFVTVCLQK
jgi:hypothetical protein